MVARLNVPAIIPLTRKQHLVTCSYMFFLPALRYTNRTLNLRLSQLPPVPLDGLNLVAGQSFQPPDHGVRQISLRNIPCSPKELPISKKFERRPTQTDASTKGCHAKCSKLKNRHQTKMQFLRKRCCNPYRLLQGMFEQLLYAKKIMFFLHQILAMLTFAIPCT